MFLARGFSQPSTEIPAQAKLGRGTLKSLKDVGRATRPIVCLVGENLRDTAGVAARVFSVLENVKIRMISQGASEINLTFVIEEDDATDVHSPAKCRTDERSVRHPVLLFWVLFELVTGNVSSIAEFPVSKFP